MRQGIGVVRAKEIAGHLFLIWSVLDLRFFIGSRGHLSHLDPDTLVPEFCRLLIQVIEPKQQSTGDLDHS